jgi:hypothetical protein
MTIAMIPTVAMIGTLLVPAAPPTLASVTVHPAHAAIGMDGVTDLRVEGRLSTMVSVVPHGAPSPRS